jgi:predicted lipid-binding transport protein (Tim44 family)
VSQDDTTPTPDETPVGEAAPATGGHPVVVYTLLRLLILGLTAGVLWLLGLRQPMILLVFAFLISGVISIFALNRRREVAAVEVVTAVQKVNQRIDSSAAAEDAAAAAPQSDQPAASGAFPGANGTGTADPAAPAASTGRPARSRDIPADDDLDDLEPTDRP